MATTRPPVDATFDTSSVSTGMVWISNQTSATITVSISNKTGGNDSDYSVPPKGFEGWSPNHWQRRDVETAKIRVVESQKTFEFNVGKDKFVNVYKDSVVMWDSEAIRF